MFTKFLHDVEALLLLLIRAFTRWYCIPLLNARAKGEGCQFRRLQKAPKIDWVSHQSPLGYRKTYCNLIIPIHISTNADNLMKIGPVFANIFGGMCRFLPSRPKRFICYPRNLLGYWTDLDQICTGCSKTIPIKYFWIAILQSVLERRCFEWT